MVLWIVLAAAFWCAGCWLLWKKPMLAPLGAWLALLFLSFAKHDGASLLPFNSSILVGWLCITLVVMAATALQRQELVSQTRGVAYMLGGALTGMVVGLLCYGIAGGLNMLYGAMIIATAAGTFFGFLLFTSTPRGREVSLASGRFFKYLLAKGFPVAVTVMMAGVALVLVMAVNMQSLVANP